VDVPPSQPAIAKKPEQAAEIQAEPEVKEVHQSETEVKPAPAAVEKKGPLVLDLGAVYVRDTIMDGTVLPPNHVFEQTWVLRNSGEVAWPAGCAVKFVGGDYMGHVDSNHPAGISELVSASESTVCYNTLEPGQEYPYTVLLRTPPREGKVISYWRLTTRDGLRFGHRLWCDISVQAQPTATSDVVTSPAESEAASTKQDEPAVDSSQMVFPKLEKESPVSSMHQDSTTKETGASAPWGEAETNEVDEWKGSADWDGSDDGFFTDEEYDILDASDEEWIEDQKLKSLKK
jgi:next-to-BRCA1 protein 1